MEICFSTQAHLRDLAEPPQLAIELIAALGCISNLPFSSSSSQTASASAFARARSAFRSFLSRNNRLHHRGGSGDSSAAALTVEHNSIAISKQHQPVSESGKICSEHIATLAQIVTLAQVSPSPAPFCPVPRLYGDYPVRGRYLPVTGSTKACPP